MKIPFFPSLFPGDLNSIVELALYELGLDKVFLLCAFKKSGGIPAFEHDPLEWDIKSISASEYVWLCDLLLLPYDSITTGYSRMQHKAWVGRAVENGTFVLPITQSTRALVSEYLKDKKRSIQFEAVHMGARLRRHARAQRYVESVARRTERRSNRRRLRLQRLRFLLIQHTVQNESADLEIPDHRRELSNSLHFLTTF